MTTIQAAGHDRLLQCVGQLHDRAHADRFAAFGRNDTRIDGAAEPCAQNHSRRAMSAIPIILFTLLLGPSPSSRIGENIDQGT